jgi:hypothetical protein
MRLQEGGFMSPRSGSENRRRKHIVPTSYNDEELAKVRASARARGCSTSTFVRSTSLGYRLPLSRVDLQALARLRTDMGSLTGEVNKIGGNVNQAVYRLNLNPDNTSAVRLAQAIEAYLHELKSMFDRDMGELRIVCLQALGKEPRREKYSGDED